MTDIVERLRLYARHFEDLHAPQNVTIGMREAADEIERLRAALKAITEVPADWGNEVYDMLDIARSALHNIVDLDDVLLPPRKDSWT